MQFLATGDVLEETVMFSALELQSLLDVRVTAKGCAKDHEPLFGGGGAQSPTPTQTWAQRPATSMARATKRHLGARVSSG